MTYSGAVKVGGPADVHELRDLMISKVAVGPMDNNAYLLRCRATDEQLLIDAANDAGTLLTLIGDDGIASVVTTHRHGDHWQALAEVVAATGARTFAGRDDAEGIPVATDVPVGDGDTIRVGRVELTARHLVGHTPGSIALVYDDPHGHPHVFTGDCLFPGGPGRTTNPVEFTSLMDGLEEKVFGPLPDETWIYPGHGNDTTLGTERPRLAEWRARGW
ncbi:MULTISPECIES: MBL fold metallo-hydrolase [Streptomyces]|uniref:Glyoxylase-like metal-dependent hydrolase (Beta-lactamase superfamily II) n=1 Tax=Streptomyces stelliscabiei TaxID=146820 RepID=A0A8I0TQ37_9ACTN|nr:MULTISPECIES: MBL fold metallo-hydrolase [Streptomyces]KND41461.1 Zn-dependent hydrolase [Streptomyces stelliscabiei]MBE1596254.1 glyoxylase-like metal-dependent hydrolase (beta-lactamase superfamily II) [Streptomyces stelliscabiei]MDX2518069.1 MBL fold metallo-hydrolase [Streptomyces stelliscabiei]MDX2555689.1 MBL fold metallo-hydrolase [Streptomyces stelliscabiei]MDX2614324.1 MBL fold metallo-hydrolase [Streptomyces stelliscabiei]